MFSARVTLRPSPQPPALACFPDMVIKFFCPNNHQLTAPENMAGKRGKCPKCQSAFMVPALDDLAAAEEDETAVERPSEAALMPAMGSGTGMPLGEVFVFLCPNGHKLNGPPSMKGKAGQCPHCGAKFRIPDDDDLELSEDDEELSSGDSGEQNEGGFRLPFDQFGETGEVAAAAVAEPLAPPPPGAAGLAYIFARLWEQRDDETEIEIFLNEGEIVSPDYYSEILSSADYGVFAIQEGDGSFAVSVIPWSSVRRVAARRMIDLPEQLFG